MHRRVGSVTVARKCREVRTVLTQSGWTEVRQAGSHETWRSDDATRTVTVAGEDSDPVPAGTPAAMRRSTGLEQLR
jgi:predicted RNA binding protein YcfA (HicA-like mRNA interferase family)